jgi:hypothetical protein
MVGRCTAFVALVLSGCVFDAVVGSESDGLADDEPGTLDQPDQPDQPDLPPGFALIHPAGATSILRDGNLLYLTSFGVIRMDPSGAAEAIASDLDGRMAQDATTLYVGDLATRSIVAIDKASLERDTVASGLPRFEEVEVDADFIYASGYEGGQGTGKVFRIPKASGPIKVIADGLGLPWGLDVHADFVYVVDDAGGSVVAIPQAGCAPFVLASGLNRPSDVLLVDDWVYFTERGNTYTDGAIGRVNRPSTPCGQGDTYQVETLVSGLGHPTWLATDDVHVYWTGYFSGLQRAPLAGGGAETIVGCGGGGWEMSEAPEQGCGAILLGSDRVVFSARTPQNGSATYAVEK